MSTFLNTGSDRSTTDQRRLDWTSITCPITQTGGLGALIQNVNNSDIDGLTITHTTGSSLYYNCGTNIRIDGLTVDATGR